MQLECLRPILGIKTSLEALLATRRAPCHVCTLRFHTFARHTLIGVVGPPRQSLNPTTCVVRKWPRRCPRPVAASCAVRTAVPSNMTSHIANAFACLDAGSERCTHACLAPNVSLGPSMLSAHRSLRNRENIVPLARFWLEQPRRCSSWSYASGFKRK